MSLRESRTPGREVRPLSERENAAVEQRAERANHLLGAEIAQQLGPVSLSDSDDPKPSGVARCNPRRAMRERHGGGRRNAQPFAGCQQQIRRRAGNR